MTRVLVTGAAGLVGHHLVSALQRDAEVFALHHTAPGVSGGGVTWIATDLANRNFVDRLPSGIDSVVHLAQSARFRDFPDGAQDVFRINVESTCELLEWARRRGVGTFVLASSGGIYGYGAEAFNEEDPVGGSGPLGFYLASKHCAELLTENYASEFTVVILRFFFVYGPGQRRSMLIPRLVQSIAEGRPVLLQGKDGLRLNPVHAQDAAMAVKRALALQRSHKINVGGPEVLSLREIAEQIGARVGTSPRFEIDTAAQPLHLVADITKMGRLLTPPRRRFADGCTDVIAELGLGRVATGGE
jgi:nucleoside-diphosphate-sugar epimerase